ncbi:MAG: hypothetical protein ACI9YO_002317 [Gammaproteobacteria bacterium]|jgi:hypothetical protein
MIQRNFPSTLVQTFTTAVKQSLLILVFVLICTVTSTKAHEGRPVFIELTSQRASDEGSIEYQMKWKIPPVLSKGQQPVVSLLGDSCKTLLPGGFEQYQEQELLVQSFSQGLIGSKRYRCSVVAKDLSVSIAYPSVNPALSSLIVVTEPSGTSRHIFSAPKKNIVFIGADLSAIEVAIQYIAGGIKHILMGWDHLLFVLCLLLIAGTLPRILIAITGFTVSHTITLILASLNLISVPSLFVETLIALSIVVLAAEIIKVRRHLPVGSVIYVPNKEYIKLSLSWRYPVLVAIGFGFVHGFGFASVLSDLGLAPSMKIIALLFFNLGVELGQFLFIAFVICTALVIAKLMAKKTQARIVNLGSYLVGVTASYWLVQRLILGV